MAPKTSDAKNPSKTERLISHSDRLSNVRARQCRNHCKRKLEFSPRKQGGLAVDGTKLLGLISGGDSGSTVTDTAQIHDRYHCLPSPEPSWAWYSQVLRCQELRNSELEQKRRLSRLSPSD